MPACLFHQVQPHHRKGLAAVNDPADHCFDPDPAQRRLARDINTRAPDPYRSAAGSVSPDAISQIAGMISVARWDLPLRPSSHHRFGALETEHERNRIPV
jgi:hypothetical protein